MKKCQVDFVKYSEEVKPELEQLKETRDKAQKKLNGVKGVIEELDEKINSSKAVADETRGARDDVKDKADSLNAIIDEQNDDITRIFENKDKRREEYFKALYEFEE